ncbi:MAG: hypothetical protein KGJ78_14555 [Alphaproteobacteria bacterium]|nr:hypothetical protein [Alphaproteobacteria bacterium]
MSFGASRTAALLLTLLMVGGGAYWVWNGLKSPPVGEPASIVTTPPGWMRVEAGRFTLFVPPGSLTRQGAGATEIIGPDFYIRYRLGTYSGAQEPLKANRDYSEQHIVIDGRDAYLRKATLDVAQQQALFGAYGQPSYLGLYMPHAVEAAVLEMHATAPGPDDLDTVEMIYKSVRFSRSR